MSEDGKNNKKEEETNSVGGPEGELFSKIDDALKETKKPSPRAREDELADRRKMVLKYRNRGYTYKDIAAGLGISVSTVKRDLSAAKENAVGNIANHTKEDFLADAISGYDDVIQSAWDIYDNTLDSELKIKAITAVRIALNDKRRALQDSGVMERTDIPQQGDTHYHAVIMDWQKHEKDVLAQGVIAQLLDNNTILAPVEDEDEEDKAFVDVDVDEDKK